MIAWYVHHQGSGHAHRALAVVGELDVPVVGLSSRPAAAGWPGRWIELPADDDGERSADRDATANATLHWAPLHHRGLRERMAAISALLASGEIRLLVADVSVEVCLLARLHGIPVAVMAQPGDRTDRAHRLAYDQAELILAPWPRLPLRPWPTRWVDKTSYLGGLSRYDRRARQCPHGLPGRRVLLAWGSGGIDVTRSQLEDAARATPGWHWQVAGPALPGESHDRPGNLEVLGWVEDMWPLLCAADVVVTHAGQNAIAEIAASRRPAVVIPQHRPFFEQDATAEALERSGLACVCSTWPAGAEWSLLLERAAQIGGERWGRWSTGEGARGAARQLEGLIHDRRRQ